MRGCEHTLLSDMIEVGSFIGLAAMTQSEITIRNVNYQQLGLIPDVFKKLGIEIVKEMMIFLYLHRIIMKWNHSWMAPS